MMIQYSPMYRQELQGWRTKGIVGGKLDPPMVPASLVDTVGRSQEGKVPFEKFSSNGYTIKGSGDGSSFVSRISSYSRLSRLMAGLRESIELF